MLSFAGKKLTDLHERRHIEEGIHQSAWLRPSPRGLDLLPLLRLLDLPLLVTEGILQHVRGYSTTASHNVLVMQ